MIQRLVKGTGLTTRHDVPQDRVPVVTDFSDGTHDPCYRDMQQHQHVRDQHQARLERFRYHIRSTCILQFLEAAVILSAYQHRYLRTDATDAMKNSQRCAWIREADDHGACVVETRF